MVSIANLGKNSYFKFPEGLVIKRFVLIMPLFIVRCLKLQSPLSKARNRKLHLKMWMAIK